jgi:hypothetical protein
MEENEDRIEYSKQNRGETVGSPPKELTQLDLYKGFHRPIVLPSGSLIKAKLPPEISTGGTQTLPPKETA